MSVLDGHGVPVYTTSTFSGGGNCVEVAMGGVVSVRHSARPDQMPLVFTRAEWDAFVKGVKNGEFDAS